MDVDNHSDDEIRKILSLKKIAVVGMSQNPGKDAHMIPKYLIKNEYDVTPVNPNADEILGRKSYDLVSEVPGEIEIVNVFRPSEDVLPVIQEAIQNHRIKTGKAQRIFPNLIKKKFINGSSFMKA